MTTAYALARMVAGRHVFLCGMDVLDVTFDVFQARRWPSADEAEAWVNRRPAGVHEQMAALGYRIVRLDVEVTLADEDHGRQCGCPRLRCQTNDRPLDRERIDHWPAPGTVESAEFGGRRA